MEKDRMLWEPRPRRTELSRDRAGCPEMGHLSRQLKYKQELTKSGNGRGKGGIQEEEEVKRGQGNRKHQDGGSREVQWIRLRASMAGGKGSITGWETKISNSI